MVNPRVPYPPRFPGFAVMFRGLSGKSPLTFLSASGSPCATYSNFPPIAPSYDPNPVVLLRVRPGGFMRG